jgi:DNA-binding response OmpR family regulator
VGKADPTQARILVVDDEPANVRLLERMLAEGGYRHVKSDGLASGDRALRRAPAHLILLDLMMPHLDGIAVIQQLHIPEDVFLPILVLTADATSDAKKRALEAGAKDFLTKPFDRLEVMLRIRNLLDTRSLYLDLDRHNRSLEQIVAERTQRLVQSEKVRDDGLLARRRRARAQQPARDRDGTVPSAPQRVPHLRHRIAFVTGDILNREKRGFLERTGAPHLLKPFDLPEVRQLVHRMLIEPGADPRPEGSRGLR